MTGSNREIRITLPSEIVEQLKRLAEKSKQPISKMIAIIITNYFKEYDKMLEVMNEKDFGVITEERLREFLKEAQDQKGYLYEDIKEKSFDELFEFWIDNFLE